jgi:hypothetical protein
MARALTHHKSSKCSSVTAVEALEASLASLACGPDQEDRKAASTEHPNLKPLTDSAISEDSNMGRATALTTLTSVDQFYYIYLFLLISLLLRDVEIKKM